MTDATTALFRLERVLDSAVSAGNRYAALVLVPVELVCQVHQFAADRGWQATMGDEASDTVTINLERSNA